MINLVIDNFKSFFKMSLIDKLIMAFLIILSAIRTFVWITTCRLYNDEISNYLSSFFKLSLLTIIGTTIIGLTLYSYKNKTSEFFIVGTSTSIITYGTLGLYGFAPCMFKHSSSMTEHIHPHPISFILKQSFLCPSYALSSWALLLFYIAILSVILLFSILITKRVKHNA